MVTVLDQSLHSWIAAWPSAEEVLDLDKGGGGLFYPPSESVTRLIPEAPTGAILGVPVLRPAGHGQGELRFFRLRGLGRALLYHMHDAFGESDGIAGPHVLLTSGTSWALARGATTSTRPPTTRCCRDAPIRPGRPAACSLLSPILTRAPVASSRDVSGKPVPQDRINALGCHGAGSRQALDGLAE